MISDDSIGDSMPIEISISIITKAKRAVPIRSLTFKGRWRFESNCYEQFEADVENCHRVMGQRTRVEVSPEAKIEDDARHVRILSWMVRRFVETNDRSVENKLSEASSGR